MRFPTFVLEGLRLPRVIFSIQPEGSPDPGRLSTLMKKAYELGMWCFDLPNQKHLQAFKVVKDLTEDQALISISHLDAEEGVSFLGNPLHRLETRLISTLRKNLFPPQLVRELKRKGLWNNTYFFPSSSPGDVLTRKEIDRFAFDAGRFDRALALFSPDTSPFLMIGEKYGDWLLALGRIDLLARMVARIRERGWIPIYSGFWTTFVLPKAKPLDVAAFAVPINQLWSLFDFDLACSLAKKFDRPLIGLNPFADGKLSGKAGEALSFLFEELKIASAVAEIGSEEDGKRVLESLARFRSIILPRRA